MQTLGEDEGDVADEQRFYRGLGDGVVEHLREKLSQAEHPTALLSTVLGSGLDK